MPHTPRTLPPIDAGAAREHYRRGDVRGGQGQGEQRGVGDGGGGGGLEEEARRAGGRRRGVQGSGIGPTGVLRFSCRKNTLGVPT